MQSSDPLAFKRIECVCTNLRMASRVVGRAYDSALAPCGINSTQYAILANVERYQPISQMDLADHLNLERTSLYRAVAILEKTGLLSATRAAEDAVAKVLSLTRAGEKLLAEARTAWEKLHGEFLESFGRERWEEMLGALGEIREHFV